MRIIYIFILTIFILVFLSCSTSPDDSGSSVNVRIHYKELRQVIDGFGGSNAWTGLPRDYQSAHDLVKLLYSKTEGAGFTILRNRIPFRERLPGDNSPSNNDNFVVRKNDHTYDYTENADGTKTFNLNWNSWDLSNTKTLIGYIKNLGNAGPENLTIMSTPWTPPNNRVTQWKENVTGVSTKLDYSIDWSRPDLWGRLKRIHYNDYADLLADYVKNFEKMMGSPLEILSVQNEPNWKVDYESAYWNGTDLRDFIKIIGQRFPMKGIHTGTGGIGIMMPEFENFNINFNDMIKPSLSDPASEKVISHIALHQYNGAYDNTLRAGAKEFPEIIESGKRFWQTEVSGEGGQIPHGTGIANALYFARMIHWDMTLSQTNAFLFWWLWTNNPNLTGGSLVINDSGDLIVTHRLYAMAQFSRFIRPGWQRIECDTSPRTGTYTSAYRNPQTKEIAIVIVNDRYTAYNISLELTDSEFENLEIFRTSEKEKLAYIGRQRVSGNSAAIKLVPMSITTLYGNVK